MVSGMELDKEVALEANQKWRQVCYISWASLKFKLFSASKDIVKKIERQHSEKGGKYLHILYSIRGLYLEI